MIDEIPPQVSVFKKCPCCGHPWPRRLDLLEDPAVSVVGYMANFEVLELGLFLFNHAACRSTIAIEAGAFLDLYRGRIFSERLNGTAECPGYCLHEGDLDPCPAACECSYVRVVLDRVKHWEKRA